jgi:hypothetical protein
LNGVIAADGQLNDNSADEGAGSGGSIWIKFLAPGYFGGAGTLSAQGGGRLAFVPGGGGLITVESYGQGNGQFPLSSASVAGGPPCNGYCAGVDSLSGGSGLVTFSP